MVLVENEYFMIAVSRPSLGLIVLTVLTVLITVGTVWLMRRRSSIRSA